MSRSPRSLSETSTTGRDYSILPTPLGPHVPGSPQIVHEQRLPSTRPLNRRWDRSRGIKFTSFRGNALHDFRWSPDRPINFAETSASKRPYAARASGYLAPKAEANKSSLTTSSVRGPRPGDFTSVTHLNSRAREGNSKQVTELKLRIQELKAQIEATAASRSGEEVSLRARREKMEKQQKGLQLERAALGSEKEALRLDQANLEDRVREIQTIAEADAKKNMATERQQLQQQREGFEEEQRQSRRQLERQAQDLQAQQSSVETREKSMGSKAAEAAAHQEKLLNDMASTLEIERSEEASAFAEFKQQSEEKFANSFAQARRRAEELGLRRQAEGRKDYDTYHRLWSRMIDAVYYTRQQIRSMIVEHRTASRFWQQEWERFTKQRPRALSGKYPDLVRRLDQHCKNFQAREEQAIAGLKQQRAQLTDARNHLEYAGHETRALTMYHRMARDPNMYDATVLLEHTQNDTIWTELLDDIDTAFAAAKSSPGSTTHQGNGWQLAIKWKVMKRVLHVQLAAKREKALRSLRYDTTLHKRLFLDKRAIDRKHARAGREFAVLQRLAERMSRDGENIDDFKAFEESFKMGRKSVLGYFNEMSTHAVQRMVVELYHGQSTLDEQAINLEIEQLIFDAHVQLNEAVQALVELYTAARGNAPARSHRELRAQRPQASPSAQLVTSSNAFRPAALASDNVRKLERRLALMKKQVKPTDPALRLATTRADLKARLLENCIKKRATYDESDPRVANLDMEITNLRLMIGEQQLIPSNHPVSSAREKETTAKTEDRLVKNTMTPESSKNAEDILNPAVGDGQSVTAAAGRKRPRRRNRSRVRYGAILSQSDPAHDSSDQSLEAARPLSIQYVSHDVPGRLNIQATAARQAIFMVPSIPQDDWETTPAGDGFDLAALMESSRYHHTGATSTAHGAHAGRVITAATSEQGGSVGASRETENAIGSRPVEREIDLSGLSLSGQATTHQDDIEDTSYQPSEGTESHSSSASSSNRGRTTEYHRKAAGVDDSTASHLTYNISTEDRRRAALASPTTNAAFWTYKLYKNKDGHTPLLHYCKSYEQTEIQAKLFLDKPIVGFDLEWEMGAFPGKRSIKDCISLVQIASEDHIGLFHLALFRGEKPEDLMPPSLRAILESPDIVKTGVNVRGDASRIEACFGIEMQACFELSRSHRVVKYSETSPRNVNFKLTSLADQVQDILLLPLKKDLVRVSAWSQKLKIDQTEYAASDAYAGFQLYHALEAKRKSMNPTPPRPPFLGEIAPLVLGDGTEIWPSTYKSKASAKGLTVVPAEEEDEFFDAVEAQDDDEAALAATDSSIPEGEVVYPTLPSPARTTKLDLSNAPRKRAVAENTTSAAQSAKPVIKRQGPPPSIEVTRAEDWVSTWRASLPSTYHVKATHPILRAYHLWHEQGFNCNEVAGLLREPPLSTFTTASYVLQALQEDLPYDVARVREVVEILPRSVHARYQWILSKINLE